MFKVPYTTVLAINPHPNADRLELLTIYGFQVVAKKDQYQVGSEVLFVPIDSVLPAWLENELFPADSKIKLNKSRVKQIRIRGFPSQGMAIQVDATILAKTGKLTIEKDYANFLGIVKYEPPFDDRGPRIATPRNKPRQNPRFHEYKGCESIKWFPNLFKDGDQVVVQEKLHGSNCRASIQPTEVSTTWKKILKFFRLLPEFENCYGSNRQQLQDISGYKGYYGEDIFGAALKKVKAFEKIKPGETIYGEIVGTGIQKFYDYGHKNGHHFVLFDVKVTREDGSQEFINPDEVALYAKERGFDLVPVLYKGPFNKQVIESCIGGASVYCPDETVKEGVVIKSASDYGTGGGKKALKWHNPAYLDRDNTDHH